MVSELLERVIDVGAPTCRKCGNHLKFCECNDYGPQPISYGRFQGFPIKIIEGETGRRDRISFYYGGLGLPDGDGHGHVVCNDGENIAFWRLPASEGGEVVIDDMWSQEKLANHMF